MTTYGKYSVSLAVQGFLMIGFVTLGFVHTALAFTAMAAAIILAVITTIFLKCKQCGEHLFSKSHFFPPKNCPQCGASTRE